MILQLFHYFQVSYHFIIIVKQTYTLVITFSKDKFANPLLADY
jgi:hypothetical protein